MTSASQDDVPASKNPLTVSTPKRSATWSFTVGKQGSVTSPIEKSPTTKPAWTTLVRHKDNLKLARAITTMGAAPSPVQVRIEKGKVKAEWMDYHKGGLTADENRVILYCHGGAYIICDRRTHRGITWRVSKHSRSKVLVVDYRLSPEHIRHRHLLKRIIRNGWGMPAGLALLSPWVDLTSSMPSFKLNVHDYLPDGSNDPLYINENRKNYYVADNSFLRNPYPMCPMLIQCGSIERLRDEILKLCVETFPNSDLRLEMYDDMVHVFQMLAAMLRISDVAIQRLGTFIQDLTPPTSTTLPTTSTVPVGRTMIAISSTKGYVERPLSDEEAKRTIEEGFKILGEGVPSVVEVEVESPVEEVGGLDVEMVQEMETVDAQLDAFEENEKEDEDEDKLWR
ncbi:Alpha/Beta hydrolase protein, partial [Chytridium lagenaria]